MRELEDAEVTEDGELLTGFLSKVSSITYDGASANYAFPPSSIARDLISWEKEERRAVNEKYKEVEEMRCLCHRIVKVLELMVNINALMVNINAYLDLISSSQKNEQELRRVQEIDPHRKGIIKVDIGIPKHRWSYNARRLRRAQYLRPYVLSMESQTAETAQQKLDWSTKKIAFETSMDIFAYTLPMLERFETWITYLQNATTPTISLVLYIMEDLIQVCDNCATKADTDGITEAEKVLSRILAAQERL